MTEAKSLIVACTVLAATLGALVVPASAKPMHHRMMQHHHRPMMHHRMHRM